MHDISKIETFKTFFTDKITESKFDASMLKRFQLNIDLDTTIKTLMDTVDGMEMDLGTIFPIVKGDENMKELASWEKFKKELKDYKLRLSELFDTDDLQTLSSIPFKWYWLYPEKATDLEPPVYIIFKYYYNNKWSDMKLYYVQKDIKNFLDELSIVTIEFRHKKEGKTFRWFYKTKNSGMNWELEKTPKKIKEDDKKIEVSSNKETATFRPNLKWDDIQPLTNRKDLDIFVY